MTRIQIAAASLALAFCASAAHAQTRADAPLEVRDIQASHGRLGPKRPTLEYFQGDQVFVRFVVAGAQFNKAGEADVLMTLVLSNAKGETLLENDGRINGVLALGGGTFLGEARLDLSAGVEPGEYTLKVRIKDRISQQKTSFERRFTCKAAAFAITNVRFYHDAESVVPAPFGGSLGEALHFRHQVIGFDRSKGDLDLVMNLRVFDESGAEVTHSPIEARLRTDDEAAVKSATHVDFSGKLSLNRVGNYTLRITVTDRNGDRTTHFEAPLRVTAP